MLKYKILLDDYILFTNKKLYRIQALISFNDVKTGDKGGLVESEDNLSQEGHCWVYDDACVYDNALVTENAIVYGDALVGGSAVIAGSVKLGGTVSIKDNSFLVIGNWDKPLTKLDLLIAQLNTIPINNKIILYTVVNPDLTSRINSDFKFLSEGEMNCPENEVFFSDISTWLYRLNHGIIKLLQVEINIDDIVSIEKGTVTTKKIKVLGVFAHE